MVRGWARAGLGCVLGWASACGGVPEGAVPAWQEAVDPGAREVGLSAGPGSQPEQRLCDRSELQQLENKARELARAEGCESVSQCRTAPVGVMACGGPRDYVVYCATTTDEKALRRALNRLARREERFNRQCDIVSICIFITEPEIELVNGVCQEVEPSADPLP